MTKGHLDTVRADAELDQVVQLMEREQIRRIPVVDDGGRLTGIIAQADLALRLGLNDPLTVEEVLEAVSAPPSSVSAG